jgi:hypothetical protein
MNRVVIILLTLIQALSVSVVCTAEKIPAVITPATNLSVTFTVLPTDVPFGTMAASATTLCASVSDSIKDWQELSPLDMGARWYFRIAHKDAPANIRNVVGLLDSKTVLNGSDYYYYFVPQENKGNVVRFTKEGAYIRNLKFPVFGFIFVDVLLDPEIMYLKFPLKTGDTWSSESTGTVFLLNLFKIVRKTHARFTVTGEADIMLDGKKEHVFKVTDDIDKGDGKTEHEEQWFGVNLGMIYQDTDAYTLELYKHVAGSDNGADKGQTTAPSGITPSAKI